jgi:hypothetical protein
VASHWAKGGVQEREDEMELLTKELRAQLPPLYSQEHEADPLVICTFFTPDSNWTFYPYEFDGEDVFFGWVVGFEQELGYFRLSELMAARGPFGLPIERDMHFAPTRLSEVRKLHHEPGEDRSME